MNKKKNMNNETCLSGDDVPLSSDEYERYQQLLSLSYPHPSRSIKAGVMEQIRADSSKENAAKKPGDAPLTCAFTDAEAPSKRKRTRKMNRFVRHGSIAACFVLIIGAVIGISPILNGMSKSDNTSMTADITGDCVSYENTMATYAATDTAPTTDIENAKPEDDSNDREKSIMYDMLPQSVGATENVLSAETEAEAVPEVLMEKAAEEAGLEEDTEADFSNNAAASSFMNSAEETENIYAAYTNSADSVCEIHGETYHTFSSELMEYVGNNVFYAWYYSEEAADECGIPSVATFVAYFNIDRELFTSLAAESEIPYDIDAIYPSAIAYTLR